MAKFNLDNVKSPAEFPSMLLLYGVDTFSMDEYLNKVIKFLIRTENDKIDFDVLDGEESDQLTVLNTASQLPMMSDKRVVVVRRFDKLFKERHKKTDNKSQLSKLLESQNSSFALILLVNSPEKNFETKFPYNIIIQNHASVEFPIVYENKLNDWVIKRFASLGKKIDAEVAQLIVSQTAADLRSLAGEVDKITLFEPETNHITLDYVLKIIGSTRQNTVFELTNAVAARNADKAISIMLNLLSVQSQEVSIILRITDLFVKLMKLIELANSGVPQQEIARLIGVNQYFLKDYMVGIRNYSPEEINQALLLLCETDKRIKSTNSNSKLIVEEMLIKIMNK